MNDFEHAPDITYFPVRLGAVRVAIVAANARFAHSASRRVAQRVSPFIDFKLVDGLGGILAEFRERTAFEGISGAGRSPDS